MVCKCNGKSKCRFHIQKLFYVLIHPTVLTRFGDELLDEDFKKCYLGPYIEGS